jgi:hypothetical protein
MAARNFAHVAGSRRIQIDVESIAHNAPPHLSVASARSITQIIGVVLNLSNSFALDRNVLGVSLSELSTQLPQRSPQSGFR